MPRSTAIQPKSGHNFVVADYQGPQTAGAVVTYTDNPNGAGTDWLALDNTAHALKIDTISEFTAAAGVTLDGVQLKDSYLVKNYTNYSPTFTASGSMTVVGTPTVSYCRYAHITSNLTVFEWNVTAFETGGTASSAFRISLPITPAVISWTVCYLYPSMGSASTARFGLAQVSTSGYVAIFQPDFSNFPLQSLQETRGQIVLFRA